MNTRKIIFIVLFTTLGIVALQVKISNLAGSTANFTLFDAFAPIVGSFLGTAWGILSVVAMQVVNLFLHGNFNLDFGSIIRLIPTMFAVIYFARQSKINLVIPVLAILAFIAHPIGRTVWFYAMFWLIPLLMYPLYNKSLLARSLGATFCQVRFG
ncbi:MAG: hypothetical protein HYW51_02345 [Candidatus Doudnabacteria bacterium]|nr:hypothetical protein [Candidatus Doudnabacteria bacterium]